MVTHSLLAEEIDLTLTIQPGSQTNITYRIGTQLTALPFPSPTQDIFETNLIYSGTIEARANVNSGTGQLETIEFTGGEIRTSDTQAILSVTVGTVPFTTTFQTSGITRTASSSEMEILAGSFPDGNLHFTALTGGRLTLSNFQTNLTTSSVSQSFDFTTDGSELIANESLFPSGMGAVSIGSQTVSSDLFAREFMVEMFSLITVPVLSPDATIPVAGLPSGQSFRQRYFEAGSLTATGNFTLLTDFGQYTADNGLTLVTGEEVNEAGLPFALLFALGLPADSLTIPVEFSRSQPVTARLPVPTAGLGFSIGVEFSPDLATDFEPIDASFITGGSNRLLAGNVDDVEIVFPDSLSQGFLRFTVDLP